MNKFILGKIEFFKYDDNIFPKIFKKTKNKKEKPLYSNDKITVILESPFAGDRKTNIKYALRCMAHSLYLGEAPFVSHLLYTQCLEDSILEDRKIGMSAGWSWIKSSDKTVVYEDYGISDGMKKGIEIAKNMGHKIEYRKIGKNEIETGELCKDN